MADIVLLNSGGLDSAIAAKKLKNDGMSVLSLHVDSGTLNAQATRVAAQETANRYCDGHIVYNADFGMGTDSLYHPVSGEYWTIAEAISNGKFDEYNQGHGAGFILSPIPSHVWTYLSAASNVAFLNHISLVAAGYDSGTIPTTDRDKLDTINPNGMWFIPMPEVIYPLYEYSGYADELNALGFSFDEFSYTHSCRQNTSCGWCDKCVERSTL